ncbi:bifunctional diguanylate cyclase/phosphodiesterase [Desulfuribacillus alkaliarsenatis]|uniref:Diguanylate cyclase n=1 Tax=Desulfuribacillus alkaliarsenatis TaxID=766136 RepID=A0A1E5G528_9FIRM|nr:EAL domain-containing protein [Desulfuribacillus alkaliarsenatis]OEF98229.1 hypothetical protein BHF68_00655 [Desulfuribacillus alkaliarsenatis]
MRYLHLKSIRLQMLLFIVLLILFQFIFIGFVTDKKLNELPEYVNSRYEEIVSAKAAEVSRELNGLIEQVNMVSNLSFVKEMDLKVIEENLSEITNNYKTITVATIEELAQNSDGLLIEIQEQKSFEDIMLTLAEHNYYITQPFYSRYVDNQAPLIAIFQAVNSGNDVDNTEGIVGIAIVVIEVNFLNDVVTSIQVNQSEQGWIINKFGTVIVHKDANTPMNKSASDIIDIDKDKEDLLKLILNNTAGTFQHYDEQGNSLLTIYKSIDNSPDWTFMITYLEKDIYSELLGVRRSILYALLGSLILVVTMTILYSNKLLKPILNLKDTFNKATAGDFEVRAEENIANELGDAGKSFNIMLKQIKDLTFKDSITGLDNYYSCMLKLAGKISKLKRTHITLCILLISLDDFKRINSVAGYEAGNYVLKELAIRFSSNIKENEIVARYFGDEFIVLIGARDNDALLARINQFADQSTNTISANNNDFLIKMSIGASIIHDETDVDKAIKEAMISKLKVKELGGNSIMFYNDKLKAEVRERQEIERALIYGIERQEFYLKYQPVIESKSQKIVATEALLRWKSEKYKNISLEKIINAAERTGLILDIGNWALMEACKQNKLWQQMGYSPMVIGVNVSALQLEELNFVNKVKDILEVTGLDSKLLELEITETNIMYNIEQNLATIRKLKGLGVRIAIDDFGTGYSSLSYLSRFPIDTLKIDRAFTTEIGKDKRSQMIVDTIISLAHTMNLYTNAEGVETKGQLEYLREKGCDFIQGYLISKPVGANEIIELLDKDRDK